MTDGEGEKGVGAGVSGTELLAMPSSPSQDDSPARRRAPHGFAQGLKVQGYVDERVAQQGSLAMESAWSPDPVKLEN